MSEMVKKRKREEQGEKPKRSDFKAFLKKRAPIYLGLIGLFVVFVIPELTKSDLASTFPELSDKEQHAVDILMNYDGPNKEGLTVIEAISSEIEGQYPNEKIYDSKKTDVQLSVSNISVDEYQVVLNFKSHKGTIVYDWNVNTASEKIVSNNPESKHLIDIVDFYD